MENKLWKGPLAHGEHELGVFFHILLHCAVQLIRVLLLSTFGSTREIVVGILRRALEEGNEARKLSEQRNDDGGSSSDNGGD